MTRHAVRLATCCLGLTVCLNGVARGQFPTLQLQPISQGEIVSPVAIANAGDGSNRLFVADQRGTIHVVSDGDVLPTPLIDLRSKLVDERPGFDERGLLGLAFHPNFGQSGQTGADKFYVYYSAPRPGGDPDDPVNPINHQSVVAEYAVNAAGANSADIASERILLSFDQPQFNHDGGNLAFGPDGMLYISTGDGGGGGDNEPGHTGGGPDNPDGGLGNSQDLSNLLGKMLRIDVEGVNGPGGEFGIPGDNPFVGDAGVREEIYAYGLRNPWRASFDRDTGRLFAADVGQGDVEEINVITSGGNYGWRIREGDMDFDPTVSPSPDATLIDPIAQYAHPGSNVGLPEVGLSVTGGVVYRGALYPDLEGAYLFGDWSTGFGQPNGTLLALQETSPGVFEFLTPEVAGGNPIGEYILAFGEDESGEVYVATKTASAPSGLDPDTNLPTGTIYRIGVVPEPSSLVMSITVAAFAAGICWRRRRNLK